MMSKPVAGDIFQSVRHRLEGMGYIVRALHEDLFNVVSGCHADVLYKTVFLDLRGPTWDAVLASLGKPVSIP
jgi:hypothetical protein